MDKNRKDKRCNKNNPLLNKILEEIPHILILLSEKEINNNNHRQIKLIMSKDNRVMQITINKISPPILANGITHNQRPMGDNLLAQAQIDFQRQMAPHGRCKQSTYPRKPYPEEDMMVKN